MGDPFLPPGLWASRGPQRSCQGHSGVRGSADTLHPQSQSTPPACSSNPASWPLSVFTSSARYHSSLQPHLQGLRLGSQSRSTYNPQFLPFSFRFPRAQRAKIARFQEVVFRGTEFVRPRFSMEPGWMASFINYISSPTACEEKSLEFALVNASQ